MKILHKYTWGLMMLSALALLSCEKNDPFAELGQVVSQDKVPFVTIANMSAAYPAGETINYNVYYWSVADDIDELALKRGEMLRLKGSLSIDDGAGEIEVALDEVFETEVAQLGDNLTHDPMDYETARNAYNRFMEHKISPEYQLLEIEFGEEESTGLSPEEKAEMEESLAKVNELAFSQEVKTAILEELKANGARAELSWEDLKDVITSIDLAMESTLIFQVRVYNEKGEYKDSTVRNVAVGAIPEE
jgi:hypothetical protein